jgi:osmoprotectant transport system permease protein
MSTFSDAITFILNNGPVAGDPEAPTLLHYVLQTLWISAIGLSISLAIGLTVGIWLGHIHRFSFLAINVSNIGRALPSLAVLAIGDAVLGLGLGVTELALVILAVPILITNAYAAIDGVEDELVDAARGMGMTGPEVLRRVELPLALPLIFAGIRTAAVYIVATATIASLAGYNGGLGAIITNEASYHLSGVIGAAICVAVLALLVDFVIGLVQRALTPRGLKLQRERASAVTDAALSGAGAA